MWERIKYVNEPVFACSQPRDLQPTKALALVLCNDQEIDYYKELQGLKIVQMEAKKKQNNNDQMLLIPALNMNKSVFLTGGSICLLF